MGFLIIVFMGLAIIEIELLVLLLLISRYKKKKDLSKSNRQEYSNYEEKIKAFAITISILLVLVIIFSIILFSPYPNKVKYSLIDVVPKDTIGLPMDVFYEQEFIFTISGWEGKLQYDKNEDRIAGNFQYKKIIEDDFGNTFLVSSGSNKIILENIKQKNLLESSIGWFFEKNIEISSKKKFFNKFVTVTLLSSKSSLSSAKYEYTLFREKPYFKVQFSANTLTKDKLDQSAYGIILKEFDLYLPNGTILKNDNYITELNEKVDIILDGNEVPLSHVSYLSDKVDLNKSAIKRQGSTFYLEQPKYEIFYNNKTNQTIIIYSPIIKKAINSFYWNVFWFYVSEDNGKYPPLYFIILEESKLAYCDEEWIIQSKYYDGNLQEYIDSSVDKMRGIKDE